MLWKDIYAAEKSELASGRLKPGELYQTAAGLSEKYHVSGITARRVLAELARAGAVRNVPRVGSVVAAPVAPREVLLLAPYRYLCAEDDLVISCCLKGIFTAAARCQLDIIPVDSSIFTRMSGLAPRVLLYIYNANVPGSRELELSAPENLIMVGVHTPGPLARSSSVGTDSAALVGALVDELHEAGHRRIGYCGAIENEWFAPCFNAFRAAMGAEFDPAAVLRQTDPHDLISDQQFENFFRDSAVEAMLCPGSIGSRQLLSYRLRHGVDCTVAAIGNAGTFHAYAGPRAIFRDPDHVAMGAAAVRMIRRMFDDGDFSRRHFCSPFRKLKTGEVK